MTFEIPSFVTGEFNEIAKLHRIIVIKPEVITFLLTIYECEIKVDPLGLSLADIPSEILLILLIKFPK